MLAVEMTSEGNSETELVTAQSTFTSDAEQVGQSGVWRGSGLGRASIATEALPAQSHPIYEKQRMTANEPICIGHQQWQHNTRSSEPQSDPVLPNLF